MSESIYQWEDLVLAQAKADLTRQMVPEPLSEHPTQILNLKAERDRRGLQTSAQTTSTVGPESEASRHEALQLLQRLDNALADQQKHLAELPRDERAERELAGALATVNALWHQFKQNDQMPRVKILKDTLERYQTRAKYWQEVAELVDRERIRAALQARQKTLEALSKAVGVKQARRDELARIERERQRVEQQLGDVDSFDQGKPKPLPAIEEVRKRLAADRQQLEA